MWDLLLLALHPSIHRSTHGVAGLPPPKPHSGTLTPLPTPVGPRPHPPTTVRAPRQRGPRGHGKWSVLGVAEGGGSPKWSVVSGSKVGPHSPAVTSPPCAAAVAQSAPGPSTGKEVGAQQWSHTGTVQLQDCSQQRIPHITRGG